MPTRYRPRP
jgi:transposase